jgi:hypothetical protein
MDRKKWRAVGAIAFSLLVLLVVVFSFLTQWRAAAVFSCIGAAVASLLLLGFWLGQIRRGISKSHFATAAVILFGYALYVVLFASAYQSAGTLGSPILDGNSQVESFGESAYFSIVTGSTLGYGDLKPRGWISRSLACLEVVLFWLFLGTATGTYTETNKEIKREASGRRLERPGTMPTAREP